MGLFYYESRTSYFIRTTLLIGMATKLISVVTRPNQTQFDGFSPFWLGMGVSLGFPRFQNTGMERVTGI